MVDLLSWFFSRGGRHRSIYYLGFTVDVGDSGRYIILVLQHSWSIPTDLFAWFYSRDVR